MSNKEKKDNGTSERARFFNSYLKIYAAATHVDKYNAKLQASVKWNEAIQSHFHEILRSTLKIMFRDYFHQVVDNGLANPKQFFLEHLVYIQSHILHYPKAHYFINHGLKDAWDSLTPAAKKSIIKFFESQAMQEFLLDFMHHEIDDESHRDLYANLKEIIQNLAKHSQFDLPQESVFNYTFSFSLSRSNTHLIDKILSDAVKCSSPSHNRPLSKL